MPSGGISEDTKHVRNQQFCAAWAVANFLSYNTHFCDYDTVITLTHRCFIHNNTKDFTRGAEDNPFNTCKGFLLKWKRVEISLTVQRGVWFPNHTLPHLILDKFGQVGRYLIGNQA